MMKRTLIIFAPLLLLFVEAMSVTQVFAHAAYDHSTPGRDEVVQAAPIKVDVYFKQEVLKQQGQYYVRVFDDGNSQVSTADGTVDDDNRKHMFADLSSNLANGRYIVRWSNVSFEDGDPAEGAFCFYVGVEPTAAQQEECAAFAEEEPTAAATSASSPEASATLVTTVAETPQPSPTVVASPGDNGSAGHGIDTGKGHLREIKDNSPIIGGVIGGAVVLAIIAGGVFVWLRRMLE